MDYKFEAAANFTSRNLNDTGMLSNFKQTESCPPSIKA